MFYAILTYLFIISYLMWRKLYIDAAKGGKISVIHETVNFTYIYEDTEVPGNTYTWVLWLSDVPFGG